MFRGRTSVTQGAHEDLVLFGLVVLMTLVLPGLVAVSLGFWAYATPAQAVVGVAMVVPLLLRTRHPMVMLALVTAAGVAHLFVADRPLPSLVVVPIVAYSVARLVRSRWSRVAVAIGALASIAGPITWYEPDRGWNPEIAMLTVLGCGLMVLTPYIIGRRRLETAIEDKNRARAAQEAAETILAERERNRQLQETLVRQQIASELHDIVTHSVSQMVVQAEGGRAASRKRPELAAQALDEISETGREALTEIRRVVTLLRDERTPHQ
ncbi:DUF7134 domain-containing protein [Enemella evansiae]|uniref:DUF7134 domain-containing protein n=1 Tax=Enemella evansiae TaxID=2016499 RepID=UPI0011807CCF|nr:histidine kinase dimerization/phosphoacceptor domain-containing protein [Enemella evansiae]